MGRQGWGYVDEEGKVRETPTDPPMPENADPMSALREAAVAQITEDWFTAKYPHIEDAVGAAFDSGYDAALRVSLAPETREDETWAQRNGWPEGSIRDEWNPRAPSLEGARHPEAGETE